MSGLHEKSRSKYIKFFMVSRPIYWVNSIYCQQKLPVTTTNFIKRLPVNGLSELISLKIAPSAFELANFRRSEVPTEMQRIIAVANLA